MPEVNRRSAATRRVHLLGAERRHERSPVGWLACSGRPDAEMGLVSLLRLAFGGAGDGVSLTFPRVDRKNAEALAAALAPVPTA
ncbi:hypothetical protein [Micromonospora zamorensis]|uniref:hypothetical protein n=1 Tax=Micromonospora zamorensis TaxID=709883 RepID=UPI0037A475B2